MVVAVNELEVIKFGKAMQTLRKYTNWVESKNKTNTDTNTKPKT